MIARLWPRLGLAAALVTPACASDLDEGLVTPAAHPPRLSHAQIYDRDRTLVAGVATSLALGVVGLGTVLASGIYAAPGNSQPHTAPPAMRIAGGIMSAGFLAAIPFAIGVERHRARYPEQFPGSRGRSRGHSPRPPPSSANLRPLPTPHP